MKAFFIVLIIDVISLQLQYKMLYNSYNLEAIGGLAMFSGKEYVLAVDKERSFSKAAEKLFISQPSLSANIKRIEKRIGKPIFDRSSIPLQVTEFGEEYLRSAKEVVKIEADFTQYLTNYDNLNYGRIVLGGTSLFAAMILPRMMAAFSNHYPAIEFDLHEATTSELVNQLHSGEIDLLFDNTELDADLYDSLLLTKESLLLAVPQEFPINDSLIMYQVNPFDLWHEGESSFSVPSVALADFKDYPFVLLKPDNDTGARARALFRQEKLQPKVLFTVEQQLTAYNVSLSGMAISFVGESLLAPPPSSPKVVYYRLVGEQLQRELKFYWKKNRYQNKATQAFLQIMGETNFKHWLNI